MKKSISIILASICIVGLIGCSSNKNANTKITENKSVEQNTNKNNSSKSEEKENSTSPLIGEWSDIKKGTIIEFTKDGKLLRAGTEVATYESISENTVKLHNSGGEEEIEITYELDGDTLKWGTNWETYQEFAKYNPKG